MIFHVSLGMVLTIRKPTLTSNGKLWLLLHNMNIPTKCIGLHSSYLQNNNYLMGHFRNRQRGRGFSYIHTNEFRWLCNGFIVEDIWFLFQVARKRILYCICIIRILYILVSLIWIFCKMYYVSLELCVHASTTCIEIYVTMKTKTQNLHFNCPSWIK